MTAKLEIPFPPIRQPAPGGRMEPPFVPVEPRWEYKEVVRDPAEGLLSEAELNVLGADHWELAGVAPARNRVHFYFKRERPM